MGDIDFYRAQVSLASNGIAAFAVAQNIAFTAAVFSADALRHRIQCATFLWAYLPLAIGIAVYCILVCTCLALELWISNGSPAGDGMAKYAVALGVGRVVGIVLSSVPLAVAIMSVRNVKDG